MYIQGHDSWTGSYCSNCSVALWMESVECSARKCELITDCKYFTQYICVRVSVAVCVCACARMCVCMYMSVHTRVRVCVCVCVCTCMLNASVATPT